MTNTNETTKKYYINDGTCRFEIEEWAGREQVSEKEAEEKIYFYIKNTGIETDDTQWKITVDCVVFELDEDEEYEDEEYEDEEYEDEEYEEVYSYIVASVKVAEIDEYEPSCENEDGHDWFDCFETGEELPSEFGCLRGVQAGHEYLQKCRHCGMMRRSIIGSEHYSHGWRYSR